MMNMDKLFEREDRLQKFKSDYSTTNPSNISQLAADGMIVVIDLEQQLTDLRNQTNEEVQHLQRQIVFASQPQRQCPVCGDPFVCRCGRL